MKRPIRLLTLSLAALGQLSLFCATARADELFSRVPIDSVFSTPAAPQTGPDGRQALPERGQKVMTLDQLMDLLRDAGLEPESDGEKLVTVKLQHARWTFSVALALTEERDEILMVLLLSQLDGKALGSEKLLSLLAANREHQPATFSFSEKLQRLELSRSVTNYDIKPRLLREEMRSLAAIAESTASLWELDQAETTPAAPPSTNVATAPAATAPKTTTPPPATTQARTANAPQTAPAAASGGLTGKWSAARNAKEAFAMLLNNDGTFVLVHVKDGKQNRSSGKFTLNAGQLTLAGTDGSKIVAGISNLTQKTFDFTPQGGSRQKLTFQKAS